MSQWVQEIVVGWPMIWGNLPTFFVILLIIAGAVWAAVNWSYKNILAGKSTQIEIQDRQIADYKEKLGGATPDQAGARKESKAHSDDPLLSAIEGDAHERLDLFIVDCLRPTLWAQVELQNTILQYGIKIKKFLFLAQRGLINDYNHWVFCEAYREIEQFGGSPMPIVTNGQMIDAITKLENKNYKAFCDQADELARAAHTDVRRNATLYPLWEEWRLQHNALVDEYDKLKRESRFGPPLYPQLPSRWGDKIDQLPEPIAGSC